MTPGSDSYKHASSEALKLLHFMYEDIKAKLEDVAK